MALKNIVHEICPKCGKIAARQDSDGTVCVNAHDCPDAPPGPPDYPRSFRPEQVIFVSSNDPLTEDDLSEIEKWGRLYTSFSGKVLRMIDKIRKLKADKKRLSSDLEKMTKEYARLKKVLLDVGKMLGVEIGWNKES